MKQHTYNHKVQYYETDKMGITHHSNYVRWMEEARIDFLDSIGWNYDRMEKMNIISPVLGVNCKYKQSTTFDDTIAISVDVKAYNGLKLVVGYTMKNIKDDKLVFEGESEHCFLNENGKLLRLKNECLELHETLLSWLDEQ